MQINWPEGDRLTWAYVLMGLPQKTEKNSTLSDLVFVKVIDN